MRSTVIPIHVANLPDSMALIQVEGTGMKAALWRYFASQGRDFCVYALLMTYSGAYMVVLGWVGIELPEPRSMVQRQVAGPRTPIGMSLFFVFSRI